ncbi:hypothetical protein G7B40_020730 [Aetokthonos hydrillicola Thurmond2011]|uniref:Uncharacterized protein n=1 Tax=Aetokthonos hydrillicola Thurmond2011 TaxID=2712845 RepID=A0AAP5MBK0_9CYAN|nr:hypothetical protein [Aetokthonos hydrillicola]MBO3462655.1 hypothetical protein [Aetokthonos hydrillicola CCALA 1050]MBW4589891.1 hypothetical protein [Aetokthonos hydrillicola CCALA 1050]MDR9896974.1 hypothetical protein [Aetokthonos hydrillicola Thurmond2011]
MRLIEVIWVASDLNNAPKYEEVFGCPIVFPGSGKVHRLENIQDFKERWDEHGGLKGFQTYARTVLDNHGEWKELLAELEKGC